MKITTHILKNSRTLLNIARRNAVNNIARPSMMIKDEEFLPDIEEKEIEYQKKADSTL
jgi:hypothetical protein